MSKKRRELSHEEIWDDSALLESWDEALEEYKLYHSIHAKGQKVEDVIADFKGLGDAATDTGIAQQATEDAMEASEEGEWEDPSHEGHAANVTVENVQAAENVVVSDPKAEAPPLPFPENVAGQGSNDALKQLMMSWYWAGYYTGLYQGQQQPHVPNDSDG